MKSSGSTFTLCLLSAALLALCFPGPSLGLLAWVALVPMLAGIRKARSRREAVLSAWAGGFFFFLVTLAWLRYVTVFGWLFVVVLQSLSFALFGLLLYAIRPFSCRYLRIFCAACTWTLIEIIRSEVPVFGLGFNLLAYSQADYLQVIQAAGIAGALGLGFMMVLVNASLAEGLVVFFKKGKGRWTGMLTCFLIAAVIVAGILAYGRRTLDAEEPAREELRISVVQGNIPQSLKWEPMARDQIMEIYLKLTELASYDGPSLIIWPEASFPGYFNKDSQAELIKSAVRGNQIPLILGAPHMIEWDQVYNSAYLLDNDGEIAGRYDKISLVPFGEYVPFGPVLAWLRPLAQSLGVSDFLAGSEATVFQLPGTDVRFSVVICFEDTFHHLVRRFAEKPVQFLAVITNDAWFGPSGAPYQHLQASVFRAVENGIPIVRAANTGVSAFISSSGKILGRVRSKKGKDIFIAGRETLSLPLVSKKTFYQRGGWMIPYGLCLIFLVLLGLAFLRGRRQYETPQN